MGSIAMSEINSLCGSKGVQEETGSQSAQSRRARFALGRSFQLKVCSRHVGRLAPDFRTLADFRAGNTPAIKNVCREVIVLCRRWQLFTESTVAIDGSKFKAINHRDRNFTRVRRHGGRIRSRR